MTTNTTNTREWVSALHDDALTEWPQQAPLDDEVVMQWHETVHLGQAMRGEAWGDGGAQQRILRAVQQVYVTSPVAAQPAEAEVAATEIPSAWPEAANERVFSWSWAAALVLAVGAWLAWPQAQPSAPVVAQAPVPEATLAQAEPVLVEQNGVIRDPRLDALLQSHRQSAWGSALQYPAGFVRSVALER